MVRKSLFLDPLLAVLSACAVGSPMAMASAPATPTATPIRHLVVLFDENVSFDHYFATYPHAANPPGEPAFHAAPATPRVNGLRGMLLADNPNLRNPANGRGRTDPFRLDRSQAATADQNHGYTAEQRAYDGGKADAFPAFTGRGTSGAVGAFGTPGQVMGYFDGNTVTALWNYAQHFAMSDAAYTNTYGPSTPGALEVVSGQTDGVRLVHTSKPPLSGKAASYYLRDGAGGYGLISDVDPAYDVCSNPHDQILMRGRNIGDLLDARGVSWGGFMGGFDLQRVNANGSTGCRRSSTSAVTTTVTDYIPHHNWFQYFPSTANPTHARPSSLRAIGHSYEPGTRIHDPANHEYGLNDFFAAVKAGNFPAVSFLKAPAYEDAHAGYSDPLDEQAFVTRVVNFLEQQPQWRSTAVIVTYDDSDGWYDHAFATPTNPSFDAQADQLDGPGKCGRGTPMPGLDGRPVNGRCGPGTRIPFLVISPWARPDFVSHRRISLASVTRFIEDNWLHGERLGGGSFDASSGSIMNMFRFGRDQRLDPPLYLDPARGTVLRRAPAGSDSPASS